MKLKDPVALKLELLNDLSSEIDRLIKYITDSKQPLPGILFNVEISLSLSPEDEAYVDAD